MSDDPIQEGPTDADEALHKLGWWPTCNETVWVLVYDDANSTSSPGGLTPVPMMRWAPGKVVAVHTATAEEPMAWTVWLAPGHGYLDSEGDFVDVVEEADRDDLRPRPA